MCGGSASISLCIGLPGLIKSAILEAPGTSSRRISIRFPTKSSGIRVAKPVMLPLGRERLCTRPSPTGSATATNTIGTVAVADFRAKAACGPAVTSTSGLRAIKSATEDDSRPGGWENRYSILKFLPSTQPRFRSLSGKTSSAWLRACPLPSPTARKPSRRRAPWAPKRGGQPSSAAVPAMNSRRFIRPSSQFEDDEAQSITPRWSSHQLRARMVRRKLSAWRTAAMGQKRRSAIREAFNRDPPRVSP